MLGKMLSVLGVTKASLCCMALCGALPLDSMAQACPSEADALAQPAGATPIYVDGLNGRDYSNTLTNGSPPQSCGDVDSPCRTPKYAIALAGPGTTIHLLPTTGYGEPLYIRSKKGAPGKPITIQGDGVAPHPQECPSRANT